jgi:hypothetical protein
MAGVHLERARWLAPKVGVGAAELDAALAAPHYGRSVWYEAPLNAEWLVSCRLAPQDGRVVVAELRIFPIETNRPRSNDGASGYWSGEVLGTAATVPTHGLTARLIRDSLRLGRYATKADEALEVWRSSLLIEATGLTDTERGGRRTKATRERRGHPAILYARLAHTYASAVADGRNPTAAVASRHRLTIERARDLVHKARVHGFITRTERGIAGGALTPKAKDTLRQHARKRRARR